MQTLTQEFSDDQECISAQSAAAVSSQPFLVAVMTALAAASLKCLYSKHKHCCSHLAFICVNQGQRFLPLYNLFVSSDSGPIHLIFP